MDTASIEGTLRAGTFVGGGSGRRSVGTARVAGLFALAHMLAMFLALTGAILLERSLTSDRFEGLAVVCLGVAAALILAARRGLQGALYADARRRGLPPDAARDDARRRLERHDGRRS